MSPTSETAVTELNRPYPLPRRAVDDFARDGFVHLSAVLQAETVATNERAVTSEVIRLNRQHRPLAERDTSRTTEGDLSFDVADDVAATGSYDAKVTVSYYDSGTGSLSVQYDAGAKDRYHEAGTIALTGTDTWKTADVTLSGAWFGGQQHSAADFRLRNVSGQLTVHSVAVKISGDAVPHVTDFAPPVTVASPAAGDTVDAATAVSGSAEPGATVTVTSGDAVLCRATVSDGGSWTCTGSGEPAAGPHTFKPTAARPAPRPPCRLRWRNQPRGKERSGRTAGPLRASDRAGLREADDAARAVVLLKALALVVAQPQGDRRDGVVQVLRLGRTDDRRGHPGCRSSQASATWARVTPRSSAIAATASTMCRSVSW